MLHYKDLGIFMQTTINLSNKIIEFAMEYDAKVTREGIESIAPLYGLPIPLKGVKY
jgi:hypothetical protein